MDSFDRSCFKFRLIWN